MTGSFATSTAGFGAAHATGVDVDDPLRCSVAEAVPIETTMLVAPVVGLNAPGFSEPVLGSGTMIGWLATSVVSGMVRPAAGNAFSEAGVEFVDNNCSELTVPLMVVSPAAINALTVLAGMSSAPDAPVIASVPAFDTDSGMLPSTATPSGYWTWLIEHE